MSAEKLIKEALEIMGDASPLNFDCGTLCERACCVGEGYMMVFPGEINLLKNNNYMFGSKDLISYGRIQTVTCDGTCNRDYRPLSCRIYPLAPKFIGEELFVRLDVRGRPTCPLCHKSMSSLNPEFIEKVKKALTHLAKDEDLLRFLKAISNHVDMFAVPFI
ncbi:MAG: hypothetical protein JXN65_00095 [Clostridia bacterium]|nr:hypothetical protein [Clostridia bacterium]